MPEKRQQVATVSCLTKTQYVQISNKVDTSIKLTILGQSTYMVKGCMDIMFDIGDAAFS